MREKILKQYTQIPNHLYVKRKADDQIKRIISDMLKPGYVSVARQMGKTNLLQYAQRSLQSSEQIITYIDVTSADYDTVQDYFHYIVDTILETNENNFHKSRETIYQNRTKLSLAPAKEYQNELRGMLKEFNGKIIIILDEVDSLVKYDFSDQIFAQIRSGYFMKNTFNEFERISYILSGVIEPTRLIKSKENSPFNIAQKIFLDDFSKEEFLSFIQKCDLLSVKDEVIDRIYYWTNGNPRMTYDVSSEIEDLLIERGVITREDVDNVVENLYLLRYDQAPIDHIRDLLVNNVLLRNAVSDIRNKVNISDDMKSQLYLYGVINSNFDSPRIKNVIVDKALSEEWLTNINIQNRGLYIYAIECINNEKYLEAIKVLDKFINEDPSSSNVSLAQYYLGLSYKEIGDYEQSNKHLMAEPIILSSSNKALYRSQFIMIGTNFWYLNDLDAAEVYYKKVINENIIDSEHLITRLNLSAIYDRKGEPEKAKEANQTVITEIQSSDKIKNEDKKHLSCVAYFNLGKIEESNKNKEYSLEYYEKAISFADHNEKALIYLRQYFIYENTEKRVSLFEKAVSLILEHKIVVEQNPSAHTMSFDTDNFDNLLIISQVDSSVNFSFDSLLSYTTENIYKTSEDIVLLRIASMLIDMGTYFSAAELFNKIINKSENSDVRRRAFIYLTMINRHVKKPYLNFFKEYYISFKNKNPLDSYTVDRIDISTYLNVLLDLREKKDYRNVLLYANVLEDLIEKDFTELLYDRSLLQFILADVSFKSNNKFAAKDHAVKCLSRISEIEKDIIFYKDINKETILYMKSQAEYMSNTANAARQTTIYNNKPSRNDVVTVKYLNGETKTGKFKSFEHDVNSDQCIILSKVK